MASISHIGQRDVGSELMVASTAVVPPSKRAQSFTRLAIVWNAILNLIAPLGYEDGLGFHYGEMPKGHRSN